MVFNLDSTAMVASMLSCSVETCCFSLSVLGLELGGRLKGISLLFVDAIQTVLSTAAGFCVGHAENVIGLDALVDTAVAWDWVSKLVTL